MSINTHMTIMYVYIHICIDTYMYACLYLCIYVYMFVGILYEHTFVYVCP